MGHIPQIAKLSNGDFVVTYTVGADNSSSGIVAQHTAGTITKTEFLKSSDAQPILTWPFK